MKIHIYDAQNPPPGGFPGGRTEWKEGSLGYYTPDEKVIALRQQDFQNGGSIKTIDTIHHEMGHALDDMLYPDEGSRAVQLTEKDPAYAEIYGAYREQAEEYAVDAQEYFANGMGLYTQEESGRKKLQRMDPALYSYLENALARTGLPSA